MKSASTTRERADGRVPGPGPARAGQAGQLTRADRVARGKDARALAARLHDDPVFAEEIGKLTERIALLSGEIARLEAAATKKRASKDAADSFFKR